MGLLDFFRSSRRNAEPELPRPEGYAPVSLDTGAAIAELSKAVRNNPDAVEIYLALGNLYRSQGEIERAVQIRKNLIVRPGLDGRFKAKAWFELGRDYKRGGFVDRAVNAFEKARSMCGDVGPVTDELARLAAETGEFEEAARYYAKRGQPVAQAHFLVRRAMEFTAAGDPSSARKLVNKALRAYPGSPEAWLALIGQEMVNGQWKKADRHLRDALAQVPVSLQFVVLNGLIEVASRKPAADDNAEEASRKAIQQNIHSLCEIMLPAVDSMPPDLLRQYFGANLLLRAHRNDDARDWLEKALLIDMNFWAARLDLLRLDMNENMLPPSTRNQLEFFIEQASQVKRFFCTNCGLRLGTTFFCCPRCQTWHSIGYRTGLHD